MNKILISLILAGSLPATAQTIYVTTGPDGEVSFSDVAAPDAAELKLDVPEITPDQAEAAQRNLEATQALLDELAAARQERARQANARGAVTPAVIEPEPRQTYRNGDWYPYPWYDPRPPVNQPPEEPTIEPPPPLGERRPFEPAFRPVPPANSSR